MEPLPKILQDRRRLSGAKVLGRGVLLSWIIVGQRPIALAVGAGGVFRHFSLICQFFSFSLSLGD